MYVVNLKDLRRKNINLVGGKGANLGELLNRNFLVPGGFVVTTIAYERYLLSNGIYLTEEEEDYYEKINECIKNGKFPVEMLNEIKQAYENMGVNKKVAVRSSATAEDLSDASFAGQQESYLNVEGFENLLCRIKDCFASCFTNRSVKYRKHAGYGFTEVKAAVVVQEMVQAEVAGVLFTANIISGNERQMLINSSYGLGESVVSGTVNPDEYILGQGGKVIRKHLGKKENKIIYGKKEVVRAKVETEDQKRWTLNSTQLKSLYEIGKKIEMIALNHVDIEWALKDNKIYILQSRAITTLKVKAVKDSFSVRQLKMLSNRKRERLAFTFEHVPYAFYPLDYHVALLIGGEKNRVFNEVGIDSGETFSIDNKGVVTLSYPRIKFEKNIFTVIKNIKKIQDIDYNLEKGRKILKECKKEIKQLKRICFNDKTLSECGTLFKNITVILQRIGYARFRYFIVPAMFIGRKLRHYLKSEKSLTQFDLLKELPYCTRKINSEFTKLADYISSNGEGKEEKIEEFLSQYGDKSNYSCYPFSALSWNEDKKGFMNMLKVLVNRNKEVNRKVEIQYDNVLYILEKNAGKKKNQIIQQTNYYRECHIYREESQYMWEECHAVLRKLLVRTAGILHTEIKDLWFLLFPELLCVCERGFLTDEDIKKIDFRKVHRGEVEGRWNDFHMLVAGSSEKENILTGINGSNGVKRGRACVVLGKEDFSKVKRGDILVCNCTSPEWTPLFSMASAVISDTGGTLSHAAVVAREYGIPAVLGTGNATAKIHDGDEVWVNASKGKVLLC